MTPNSTPNAFAAAIVSLVGAVLAAIDPSGVLGSRWSPVIVAGAAVVMLFLASRKTVTVQAHVAAVDAAKTDERLAVIDEVNALALKPAPKARTRKATS